MQHNWLSGWLWLASLCAAASLTWACGDSVVERAPNVGKLQLPLRGTSSSGVTYRLRYGEFSITGASAAVASTEDALQAETISIELKTGRYMIELNPGWVLERATVEGGFVTAQAVLTSINPQSFTVEEHETSSVVFRFRLGDDTFALGNGGVNISIEVDDTTAGTGGVGEVAGAGGVGGTGGHLAGATNSRLSAVLEVGPKMEVARMNQATVTLEDGRVLLLGGHGTNFVSLDSAELFDPNTNDLRLLPMQAPRDLAAVQRLADGRYLIAGGSDDLGVAPGYQTAELFDPKTLAFSATGNMVRPRMCCDGALLQDGRVLVVGGWYSNDSAAYGELYDPSTGRFVATGPLNVPRSVPVLLPTADGRVVILGGRRVFSGDDVTQVEVYSPDSNSFTLLRDDLMSGDPGWHVVSTSNGNARPDEQRMSDGRYLLLAGGSSGTSLVAFDPETLDVTRVDGFSQSGGPLVFDSSRELAYIPYGPTGTLGIARFDIRAQSAVLLPVAGFDISYAPAYASVTLVDATRLWVSGGSSCTGSSINFCAVRDTFFVRLVGNPY